MKLALSETDLRELSEIQVEAKIKLKKASKRFCFYLAYNDSNYFNDKSQQLTGELRADKKRQPIQAGIQIIEFDSEKIATSSEPFFERIFEEAKKEVSLKFAFKLPKWSHKLSTQILFQNFYPQILEDCESKSFEWSTKGMLTI